MRRLVLLAGALLVLQTAHGTNLEINPLVIDRTVAPGGTDVVEMTVKNSNPDAAVHVVIEKLDWTYHPADGTKNILPPGASKFSLTEWMDIEADHFELAGGETKKIKVTLHPPENAAGGYYSGLAFSTTEPSDTLTQGNVQASITSKMVALLSATLKNTVEKKGELLSFEHSRPDENKPLVFTAQLKNTGNVRLMAKGTIVLTGPANQVVANLDLPDMKTLPGDTAPAQVEWSGKLEEGTYAALLTLPLGGADVLVREEKFTVEKKLMLEKIRAGSIDIKNDGNFNMLVEGPVQLLDEQNVVQGKLTLPRLTLGPGRSQTVPTPQGEKIKAGRYKAVVVR